MRNRESRFSSPLPYSSLISHIDNQWINEELCIKYAVRWCHLTPLFIALGEVNPHQFIAMNPKLKLQSVPIELKTCLPHIVMSHCINRGNCHVINDHLQAKNMNAGPAPRYVITAESKFFRIFFLSDTLAVRLLGSSFSFSLASSSCLI